MEVSSSHQLDVFFICVLSGIVCGIFFDLQRSVRKISCRGRTVTTLQDLLFALFYVGVALFVGFNFNHGEVRYYQVLGVVFGVLLYLLLFSSLVMKIIELVGKAFYISVIKPLGFVIGRLFNLGKRLFSLLVKAHKRIKVVLRIGYNIQKNNIKWLKKRMKML